MNIFSFQTLCKWRSNKAVVWHSFNFGLNPLIKRIAIPLLRKKKTMKKLMFLAILTYMFCFLYGCTGIDDATWRQHLMERERLLDRSPTFLEVNEKNMKKKKRSEWPWREPWRDHSRICEWSNLILCEKKI